MKGVITIFTPTYNRAHLLLGLYEALKRQTNSDFEWLIVDDGSVDDTQHVVETFTADNPKFEIRYFKKENEGLNQTINKGLDMAQGALFCRVDSDDSLFDSAVQDIYDNWHRIESDDNLCALVFLTAHKDNPTQIVGRNPFSEDTVSNFFEYRVKYKATGDRLEVIKTNVHRQYKYPQFSTEKFCPEGLIWNRIAKEYNALYVIKPIYLRFYHSDSITGTVTAYLRNNAIGSSTYYAEICKQKSSFPYFAKAAILYYRYVFFAHKPIGQIFSAVPWYATLLGFPLGGLVVAADAIYPKWENLFKR